MSLTFFVLATLTCPRWISLLTVMAGVSLVGYSGSLIKDTISDALNLVTVHPTSIASDPIDQVDVTKALVGTVNHIFRLVSFDTIVKQACFSSCLLKYCKI